MFESQEHNILRNLENNKQLDVGPAEKVIVNALDEILLEKEISKDNGIRAISLIDVYTGKTRNIWTGKAKVQ
jgi:hypothetical protein